MSRVTAGQAGAENPPAPVRQAWQLGERGQRWLDIAIVVVLVAPGLAYLIGGNPVTAGLAVAQSLPLLWRRSRPAWSFAAISLASFAQVLLLDLPIYSQLAFPIAVYSVARYAGGWFGIAALATGALGSVLASVDWMRSLQYEGGALEQLAPVVLSCLAFVVPAWALGALARIRRAYIDALLERSERLAREASQQAELAAAQERARIAREMHDVVAHGLTTIIVQADGARFALTGSTEALDQTTAEQAFRTIATTARASLTEMRQTLGLLRGDESDRSPQPRLAEIAELAGAANVRAELIGLDTPVPDGVALTAYRVVQEALTNVRKHAGEATVELRVNVCEETDDIVIEVLDDGRGAAAASDGRGQGLRGMRERVAIHGGVVHAGPRPGGGFAVRARIPR